MTFTKNPKHRLSAQKLAESKLQREIFPNQVAAGSFTPHSTIVEVSCFRTDRVVEALRAKTLFSVREDIQVLCHEMTHWLDFFGTIWGREYILAICRGYRAFERLTEAEFPRILELFDQDRRVLAPAYYRFTNPPSSPHHRNRPWSIDFVTGAEIDAYGVTREDRPIFMAKFGENPSRETFARQPISVGALLEVRAIASEVVGAIDAINTHSDDDEKFVETHRANKQFNSLVYDHELIEYNSAAHILSVQSGVNEFFLSYRLASALAYLALNLTKKDFEGLREPQRFSVYGKRNRYFKKNLDRGYAFVCMVFNGGRFEGNPEEYIEKCVAKSNLGSSKAILNRAAEKLENPIWFSGGSDVTLHFFRESAMGANILDVIAKEPLSVLRLSTLLTDLRAVCPPFLDSEANFVELNVGRLYEYRPERMHDAAHALRNYTRNLLTGSRGV